MMDFDMKYPILHFKHEEVIAILAQFDRTLLNLEVDINTIKSWIQYQSHLTHMPDDRFLLNMLIRNKFSLEKTKRKIDQYYLIRGMMPHIFANCEPSSEKIQRVRKVQHVFTLSKLVDLNRVAFLVIDDDNCKFDPYAYSAKFFMDCDIVMHCDVYSNLDIVLDFSATNLAFWRTLSPVLMLLMDVYKKFYTLRCNTARVIGVPVVAHKIVNAIISNLPEKVRKRRMELAEFYPKELLPVEYGGKGSSYREMSAEFNKMVDNCEDHLRTLKDYKYDPCLQPDKLINDELLGFYGNFRQLDVD